MDVDIHKLTHIGGFERASLPDGSVRLIRYRTDSSDKELLTVKPGYSSGIYSLTVNLPSQRTVDAVINIVRSSANCYRLTYSDGKRTDMPTFSNYSEINSYLLKLDQIKLQLPNKAQTG